MKINDGLIARFDNEIRIFAKKYGLTAEIEHTLFNEKTDICMSDGGKYKRYILEWNDVPNFTTAINGVVRDASMFFTATRTNYSACSSRKCDPFEIKNVIFSNPATIVFWADGTKTVVKCQEDDIYSEEVGLALCFAKKALGNKSNYNNVFKKWVPEEKPDIQFDASKLFGDAHHITQGLMDQFREAMKKSQRRDAEEV